MPNRRHHIHIVCVAHDQPMILDSLAVFFQSQAFLTYDVATTLPESALYGRQCIESCNYIIVVIGDSYGASQNIGVSQMHLSYLSAKAKLKPMLVLIKTYHTEEHISRQLQSFTRLVEQQSSHIYYYNDNTDIQQLLAYAYKDMIVSVTTKSQWVQENTNINSSSKQNVSSQRKVTSESDLTQNPLSKTSDYQYSKLATTPNPTLKNTVTDSTEPKSNNNYLNTVAANTITDELTTVISLVETLNIQYSAQAYEGGNLTDVVMSTTFTWQEVLNALAQIPASFSSYGLQSCINRLIATKAEPEIKQLMPSVHAVSRCRITPNDLAKLHKMIVAANWIHMTTAGTQVMQELWKLTFYARKMFEESVIDNFPNNKVTDEINNKAPLANKH